LGDSGSPTRGIDLGSGGGIPGLVLAELFPESSWLLLDSDGKRTGFLDAAVLELGWGDRVQAFHARAETAGRDLGLRGRFDTAVARSFGAPAVAAECGSPFLSVGGRLVVSDPPTGAADRWPAAGLGRLGLAVETHHAGESAHFTVLRQASRCPEEFPRADGVPSRRLLF
jgi:16S rRNA (guanine527-N7)-methyltransferase